MNTETPGEGGGKSLLFLKKTKQKDFFFLAVEAAVRDAPSYKSFGQFYPFYISEHRNRTSRRLHVIGTGLVILCALAGLLFNAWLLIAVPFVGYGFAWAGHYFFERNRPATFTYPVWSLMGDFRMFFEVVTRRRAF